MIEILIWGNPKKEFKRLNINPKLTWKGYDWKETEEIRVYCITRDEFDILCDDKYSENDWLDSCWRYAEGSNMGSLNTQKIINGKALECFSSLRQPLYEDDEEIDDMEYDHLLDYLCYCLGVSTESNICAVAVDLARYNHMSMVELFERYQSR
jgi:hypothetical protein